MFEAQVRLGEQSQLEDSISVCIAGETKYGQTPGELSGRLGITGPTVVKAAQRMEAAGLVARRRDDKDGRLVRIYLTERGRSVVQPIEDDIRAIGERAIAALTPEQRGTLLAALATIFEALQTEPRRDREPRG